MEYILSLLLVLVIIAVFVSLMEKPNDGLIDYGSVDDLMKTKSDKPKQPVPKHNIYSSIDLDAEYFEIEQLRHKYKTAGMSYNEYLRTLPWSKFRFHIHKLNNKCCQICGKFMLSKFHVHHLNYYRLGYEYVTDVALLCEDCHESLHRYHAHIHQDEISDKPLVEFPLISNTELVLFNKVYCSYKF